MLIRRIALLFCFIVSIALAAVDVRRALADTGSGSAVVAVDAGVAASSSDASVASAAPDAAVVASPGSAATPTSPATPIPVPIDPSTDPSGFIAQVESFWKNGGWAVALLLAAVGLCEALAKIDALKTLGNGRISLVIGGVVAVGTATLAAFAKSASWASAIVALVAAALAYWHQAGTATTTTSTTTAAKS